MKILKYTMTGSSREFYGTGTNFFRYRYRYFSPGTIFSGTGAGTFFRDQIFSVPVPVLFSGTKFFRYRYRYFFLGPFFSGTGTIQKKEQNSRDVTLYQVVWSVLVNVKFITPTNLDWVCTSRINQNNSPFFLSFLLSITVLQYMTTDR